GHFAALVERVRGIAPRTAQIARREPHEDAGPTRPGRLPLNGVEDFVDGEHYSLAAGPHPRRELTLSRLAMRAAGRRRWHLLLAPGPHPGSPARTYAEPLGHARADRR